MPKDMGYDSDYGMKNSGGKGDSKSMSQSGKDAAAKSGGGDLSMGLSQRSGMGNYAKGDAIGDHMPNGGSEPEYKVKKAGKSFTVC
jgi:hypothetical protein